MLLSHPMGAHGVRAEYVVLIKYVFALALAALMAPRLAATDIIIFTEDVPPYSFLDSDGNVVGDATARVRRFLDPLPLSYEIRLVPWNRAYALSKQLDNALVYPIMHLPSREESYHWLLAVQQSPLYIYGREDETRSVTPETLTRGDFTAVCVIGDAGCELFRMLGVPSDRILEVAYDQKIELQIIQTGRGDVFISQEDEFVQLAMGSNHKIKKLMRLPGDVQFCLAAGRQVRPDILAKLQAAQAAFTPSQAAP